MTMPPNPAKSEISNFGVRPSSGAATSACLPRLVFNLNRPLANTAAPVHGRNAREIFRAFSPGGEGRDEGGCTLFPQGLDLSPAPTGRNISAQGKASRAAALGCAPPYPVTPKGAEPFAGQNEIVAEVERRLSVAEELEAVVSANLQRATRLRQSILQKAFNEVLA